MAGEARIRRSRLRWLALVGTWAALLWAACLHEISHTSVMHLAVALLALIAWPAAFSRNPANRGFASFLLLAGAAAYALPGASVLPALLGGAAAAGLLAGSFVRAEEA
jgi:hypothetical protein